MDALVSKAAMILLSLQPGPAVETSAFNRMRAFKSRRAGPFPFTDQHLKLLALLGAQPRNVLLYRNLLPSHDCLPRQ
jgi:hypothetical protein